MPTRMTLAATGLVAVLLGGTAGAGQAVATDLGGLVPAGTVVTLGGTAIVQPRYEGGKSYEVTGAPVIKFSGIDPLGSWLRVDARNINDIGLGVLNLGGFSAGPAIGYRFDREESDGRLLRGLGDIDGGFLVGGFARYEFNLFDSQNFPAYVRASYLTQVSGEEDAGGILRLQGGFDNRISQTLVLRTFGALEFGDDDYMQTYFGVTAAQSARSGLARYSPGSGLKSFHLGATAEYEFAPTWTLTAGVEYGRLVGDAADSPVVEQEDWVVGRLGVSKAFTLGQ